MQTEQPPKIDPLNLAQAKREAADLLRQVVEGHCVQRHFAGLGAERLEFGKNITANDTGFIVSEALAVELLAQHKMLARKLLELATNNRDFFKSDPENKAALVYCGYGLQLLDILHGEE